MTDYKLFKYSDDAQKEWDDFVLKHEMGSVHQISAFKNLQQQIPGRGEVFGFGLKDDKGNIIAATFCVKMEMGLLGKHWYYSARGPVCDIEQYPETYDQLLTQVSEELKAAGGIFWRIDPYIGEETEAPTTSIKLKPATQDYQPTDTLEIDLTQSDDEILAAMKRKGRYNINLGRKKGVTIQTIPNGSFTDQDLQDFYSLSNETTNRDGFSGHGINYYRNFLTKLKKHAVLFFAVAEDGTRIATAISTFCGSKSIYYFGASTSNPQYRNLMAPYLLQWEMIAYAKSQNCTTYDFLGIAPENQPKHRYASISTFKWKFGGYRRTYQSGKEVILNNFWYAVYRVVKALK